MKKKVLILALAVALIAIMVGGSLAYFTAGDEVTNTFTIGSVKIEVVEDFREPQTMIPVVTPDDTDPNYINKDARVKNTGDNAAYVQMYVAIPKALDDAQAFVCVLTVLMVRVQWKSISNGRRFPSRTGSRKYKTPSCLNVSVQTGGFPLCE